MGRLVGMRPDRTAAIARALRALLQQGENVLAAVEVQSPGAGVQEESTGLQRKRALWREQVIALGIDSRYGERPAWLYLALTDRRVILAQRSRLTGSVRELLGAWPLQQLTALEVPRSGTTATLGFGERELRLELPQAHRFLPEVYRELPARWAAACDGS